MATRDRRGFSAIERDDMTDEQQVEIIVKRLASIVEWCNSEGFSYRNMLVATFRHAACAIVSAIPEEIWKDDPEDEIDTIQAFLINQAAEIKQRIIEAASESNYSTGR